MRKFVFMILLIGGFAFMVTVPRHRVIQTTRLPDSHVVINHSITTPTRLVTKAPRISTKKTKSNSSSNTGYSFSITGTSDTPEAARKDAIDQAARYISSALDLKNTDIDTARLEKMVIDEREGTEGFLGPQEEKGLGEGKQIELTIELPNDYLQHLTQSERGFRMDERMGWLVRGLAVIVASLFAISGYIRLDDWSKGYFSGALKVTAILAVIAAGIGAFFTR